MITLLYDGLINRIKIKWDKAAERRVKQLRSTERWIRARARDIYCIHILLFFLFFVYFSFRILFLIFLRQDALQMCDIWVYCYISASFSSLSATFSWKEKEKSIDIERSTTRIFVCLEIIRSYSTLYIKIGRTTVLLSLFWAQLYLALINKRVA